MNITVDLKAKPFYLNDDQIAWVKKTIEGMSLEDKVGQLFLLNSLTLPAEDLLKEMGEIGLKPGGYLFRGASSEKIREKVEKLQNANEIPLFIAGDLDRGSSNMISDGTPNGHQMEIGATQDPELAYKAGLQCAKECAAVGANWNFGPVCDIDFNPYNPIINVRSFGSDPEKVAEFTKQAARGMRDGGLLPCAKHWPGDGVDFRDQHYIASVNSLSKEEWDKSYGLVYKTLIDDGMESVMSAHIILPAYAKYFNPELQDGEILPGSLNYDLHHKLLREQLGFNGVIITDSCNMAGFTEMMPRWKAVPTCIQNGADIFLFTRNTAEDYEYMKQGLKNGLLTEERLDEALQRILGMKAMLKLPEKKANGTLVPPVEALEIFKEPKPLAKEIADKGITLVKDTQHLLPLNPEKQKNIYLIVIGDTENYHTSNSGYGKLFRRLMEERGFHIDQYGDSPEVSLYYSKGNLEELKKKYGCILYFVNLCSSGSDSACRISWPGIRMTMPTLVSDIPHMMVSIDNPYHLIDAPRIPTYINAYTSEDVVVETLVEKICGDSEFKGVSPVDPFCGIYAADK